ncbi:CPXV054 protein, partial [Monkeypox virus]
SVYF